MVALFVGSNQIYSNMNYFCCGLSFAARQFPRVVQKKNEHFM